MVLVVWAVDVLVWAGDSQLRWGGALPTGVVPLAGLAVFATLLLRRRRPEAVFAVQSVYALAGLALPAYQTFAGLLLSLYTVARRRPSRATARLALAVALVPLTVDAFNSAAAAAAPLWQGVLELVALWAVVSGTIWTLGRLGLRTEQEAERRVTAETARAVLEHRVELARELHDVVSHSVSAMLLQAAGGRRLLPPGADDVGRALANIEAAGSQAMHELHRILGLLRTSGPASPDDLAGLPALVERATLLDLSVTLTTTGDPRPTGADVEQAVYRVVQESLTNAAKYAGRGALVDVELRWTADRLVVVVRDRPGTGQGGTASAGAASSHGLPSAGLPSAGLGLAGLGERVAALGGTFTSEGDDGGFVVRAELPLAG